MPFFDNVPSSFTPRQKFFRGDFVRINRPKDRTHKVRAIVVGSYLDLCGGCHGDKPQYSVLLEEGLIKGSPMMQSWFSESELEKCTDWLDYDGLKEPLPFHELTERILQYYNESKYRTN